MRAGAGFAAGAVALGAIGAETFFTSGTAAFGAIRAESRTPLVQGAGKGFETFSCRELAGSLLTGIGFAAGFVVPVALGAIGAEAFTLGAVAFWAIGAAASFFGGLVVSLGSGSFVEGGHGPVRSLLSSVRCLNIPGLDSSHGPRYLQISSDFSGESVDSFGSGKKLTSFSSSPRHARNRTAIAVPGGRCPQWGRS